MKMNFTIEKMNEKYEFYDHSLKKYFSLNGYAFMDESNHCFMIVYGENRKKSLAEYLKSEEDPLKIKYKIVNLLP
jgi:hypothetical protein